MPALPAVDGVLRVGLEWAVSNTTVAFTRFYIAYTGTAPTTAQLNTFATAVGTAWNTDLAAVTNNTYVLELVTVEDLTSPTAAVGSAVVSHTGGLSGGNLPAQVCMTTGYIIARRYRGGHPRGYWPAGDETKVNNDQTWTPAFITLWNSAFVNFMTAVNAAGWTGAGTLSQVNVSYYSGFTNVTGPTGRTKARAKVRTTVPTPDAITATVGRANFGTQRRRIRSTGS